MKNQTPQPAQEVIATQVDLSQSNVTFLTECKGHYSHLMSIGCAWPVNRNQANYFVKTQSKLTLLNRKDMLKVEAFLNKHGFQGSYKASKTGAWVRLQNYQDLYVAFKMEYK